ncbi:glycosyltransferase [Candidatus Saccharibacteria bacterium]|nr:glycosyltransferase [Candidatus Saccharibacteria bacterium]
MLSFLENKLRNQIHRAKNSDKWEESHVLAGLRPYLKIAYWPFKFGLGNALRVVKKCLHILRIAEHVIRKSGPVKKIRNIFDRKTQLLRLARIHARSNNWQKSLNIYQKVLKLTEHHNDLRDIEISNEAVMNITAINNVLNPKDYRKLVAKYKQQTAINPPRIAVVMAVSGGYDSLKLPNVLSPRFDYIFYCDRPMPSYGIFDIRPMPYFHTDTTRMARYIKTNLNKMAVGYDYVVWIDANIMMVESIEPFVNDFIASKKVVGAIPHPYRTSVYSEIEECIARGKDDPSLMREQMNHLKSLGFKNNDLIESNFMIFDLNSRKIDGFFATWWAELDSFSRRDQLSLNYALKTNGIEYHRLMKRPENTRTDRHFAITSHNLSMPAVEELKKILPAKVVNPYAGKSFFEDRSDVIKSYRDKTIEVIYCVHNALEDVKICLESVKQHRQKNVSLIIIDDGSDGETKKYLEKYTSENKAWVSLNRKETGSGYTKAANRGLKLSTADLMILLNSDTIVTRNWTDKMAHAVFSTPGAGIVGPLSSAASHQSIPEHMSSKNQTATNDLPKGLSIEKMNDLCEKESTLNYYPRVPLVHGFCFGITKETVKKVGYFDEESFPYGYGEENDYCFRASSAGISLVLATNTYIFHEKSKSYSDPGRRIELMKQGNKKLQELRGKRRVERAIICMQDNPLLVKMRREAAEIYNKAGSK